MNPLPGHMLNVYQDSKPPIHPSIVNAVHNPPQLYQTHSDRIAGTHAGPVKSMTYGDQQAGQGSLPEEGSWLANHGAPWWMNGPREVPHRFTPWSEAKVASMQVRLAKRLGPEYVASRPGPGGGPKLTYIEGWKVINLANEVFGFNGWSSEIRSLHTDFLDTNKDGRHSVAVTAHVRITLADGAFHEDIGHGSGDNQKGKAAALEKAKKEAVTDAIKRALRNFGNVLGNCLYDKDYTREVGRMKVTPPKFDPNTLERRPEFAPPPAPAVVPPPTAPVAGPNRLAQQPQAQSLPHGQLTTAGLPARLQREDTPIRSIHDADETVGTVDEMFDPEFMEDSLFEGMDMSVVDGLSSETKNASPSKDANAIPESRGQNAPVTAPSYVHRERPAVPQPIPERPPARSETSRATSQEGTSDLNSTARSNAAAKRRLAILGTASTDVIDAPVIHANANSEPLVNPATRARYNTSTSHAGPTHTTPHRPHAHLYNDHISVRAASPNIPKGGVSAAAARAAAGLREQAAKYDLDLDGHSEGGVVGFSSARGIKRISDSE